MNARFFIALTGLVGFGVVLAFGQNDFPIYDPAWRQKVDPQWGNTTTTTTATTTTSTPRLAERIKQAAQTFDEMLEACLYVFIGLASFIATVIAVALHLRGLCVKGHRTTASPSELEEGRAEGSSLAGRASLAQPSQQLPASDPSSPARDSDSDGQPDVYFDAVESF